MICSSSKRWAPQWYRNAPDTLKGVQRQYWPRLLALHVTDAILTLPQWMAAVGGLYRELGGVIYHPSPSQRRQFENRNIPAFHVKVGKIQKISWLRMSDASQRRQGRSWRISELQGGGDPYPSPPEKWKFQMHFFSVLTAKVSIVQKLCEELRPCNAHGTHMTKGTVAQKQSITLNCQSTLNFWGRCVDIFDDDFINVLSKLIVACPNYSLHPADERIHVR